MLHVKFVGIHPFIDGNGRKARLLLNLKLMKSGYLLVVIRVINRVKHYEALDKAHTTNHYEDFVKLGIEEENRSLDTYNELI